MASNKLSFLNPLKERSKKPNNKDGTKDDDELAMVKAAAWAWHQHGSSNIIEGTSEFDVTRRTISNNRRATTRPSRYKLEAAVRNMAKEVAKEDQEKSDPVHEASTMWSLRREDIRSFTPASCETISRAKEEEEGSPLIHNKKELSLLDSYEVQSISRHLDRLLESNNHHNNSANASGDVIGGGRKTKKKKMMMRKGFLLRHGAICGREEDVVDPSRRQSAKSSSSVGKCLPIANTNGAM